MTVGRNGRLPLDIHGTHSIVHSNNRIVSVFTIYDSTPRRDGNARAFWLCSGGFVSYAAFDKSLPEISTGPQADPSALSSPRTRTLNHFCAVLTPVCT